MSDFTFRDDLSGTLAFNDENIIHIDLNADTEDFILTKTDSVNADEKTITGNFAVAPTSIGTKNIILKNENGSSQALRVNVIMNGSKGLYLYPSSESIADGASATFSIAALFNDYIVFSADRRCTKATQSGTDLNLVEIAVYGGYAYHLQIPDNFGVEEVVLTVS